MNNARLHKLGAYSFLALFVLCAIVLRCTTKISDGDIWFHLAYGRYFLEHWTLIPDHAIFSWTPAENNTIYCAWIPEVFFYLLYKLGGVTSLYILRYVIAFLFLLSLAPVMRKISLDVFPLALLILILGVFMSLGGLRLKAELFSFILMSAMMWVWIRIKMKQGRGHLLFYAFPMLSLVWVNSHGGFIFGLVFLGCILAGEAMNRITGSEEMLDNDSWKHLLISMLLSFLAVFITPYGWSYPLQLVNNLFVHSGEFTKHAKTVMEYQSIFSQIGWDLKSVHMLALSSVILVFLIVVQKKKHRADWPLILANAVFVMLYMRYLRMTFFWGIIFVSTALYLLQKRFKKGEVLFVHKSVRLVFLTGTIGLLIACSSFGAYRVMNSWEFGLKIGFCNPVEEAEYIRENFPNARMGNSYNSGSYLLWALGPEKKVFIDARYFPYAEWYSEYTEFMNGKDAAYKEFFLGKYRCDFWCFTYEFPQIKYFLESPKWSLAYYGRNACIFVPRYQGYTMGHKVSDSIYREDFFQTLAIIRFALQAGDLDVARKLSKRLKPLPLMKPQRDLAVKSILEVSEAMFRNGRYSASIDICSHALRLDPGSSYAFFRKGTAQAMTEDIEGAIQSYRKAVRIKPDFDMAHNNLANAYLLDRRYDDAIREYTIAIGINPGNKEAQKNLDIARKTKLKIDTGIADLLQKLKARPGDMRLIRSLGSLYAGKGDYQNALSLFLKLVNNKSGEPQLYYDIACIYAKMSRPVESVTWLDASIRNGFKDRDLIMKDKDLAAIRSTAYYRQLMSRSSQRL